MPPQRCWHCNISKKNGFEKINADSVRKGFGNVCKLSGLMGRWMTVSDNPHVICDTGHNAGGWEYLGKQLSDKSLGHLHMVIGFVNDKDISTILGMMPADATYYFTQASVKRALPSDELRRIAGHHRLHGLAYPSVREAFEAASRAATEEHGESTIFVGGSTFVVADLLSLLADFD